MGVEQSYPPLSPFPLKLNQWLGGGGVKLPGYSLFPKAIASTSLFIYIYLIFLQDYHLPKPQS